MRATTLPPRAEERRRSERRTAPRTFCYLSLNGQQSVGPVRVLNLSSGGVGLLLGQLVAPRAVVGINLFDPADRSWVLFPVRIVYAEPAPEGLLHLGGSWKRALSDTDLTRFL